MFLWPESTSYFVVTSPPQDRIHGGSAKGEVRIRNVEVTQTPTHDSPPPIQISVPDASLAKAIDMVNSCFHDSR